MLDFKTRLIMKNRLILPITGFLAFFIMLCSCENLDDLSDLGLRPHILAPALKTEIDVYDFDRLLNQNTEYIISASTVTGETGFPADVPVPFFPGYDGTGEKFESQYLSIFEIAHRIFLDTINATLSFTNTFPVSILPNTRFILRDSANPSNILFDHTLPPGTKVLPGEPYSFKFIRSKDTIASTLEFYVQDLKLDQGTNVTFNDEDFVVNLNIKVVDIEKAELKNNVSYTDTATHPFDINIPNPEDTSAYSGGLSIFLTNKYPAGFDLQLELLDENNQLIYNIFGDSSLFLANAPLDINGNVIGQTTAEKINFIKVEDINNLNLVKKMRVSVTLITPPTPEIVILNEVTTIALLITADIKVNPEKGQ